MKEEEEYLPSEPKKEKQRVEDEHPEAKEKKITPDNFKYNVGDIIKVRDPNMNLISPANSDKQYHDNLRVVFRFFDGNHVYVVEAEDRIGLIVLESDIELVETASNKPADDTPAPVSSQVIAEERAQEAYRELKDFVDKIPLYSNGFIYKINHAYIGAHSIEEAIGIFKKECPTEAVESVILQSKDGALLQNEIPVV